MVKEEKPVYKKNGVSDGEIKLGLQFGGPLGAVSIMIFSHVFVLYLWYCNHYFNGALDGPSGISDILPFWQRFYEGIIAGAMPTWETNRVYVIFIIFQALLAMLLPGIKMQGLPIPLQGNIRLTYLCNAISGWYVTLTVAAFLHYQGYFKLTYLMDNRGPLTAVAMIWGNIVSICVYCAAYLFKDVNRPSGNSFYDFFMGIYLNPRIFNLDLKMWAEIRVSWILLFLLTLSAGLKQYEDYGYISYSMWIMIIAHFLYTNACQKGEECIPTTWDIFYENYGWMLIYWNLAGVPMAYTFQSVYVYKNTLNNQNSVYFNTFLLIFLLATYYVWDTSNSQKNRLRMQQRGCYVQRAAFPQFSWGTLENPKLLKSEDGKKTLLVDGWYRYARKIHYTCDVFMASIWGMSCGFNNVLPFYYVFFFAGMIFHRLKRDEEKCRQKYGQLWEKYLETVPYAFIPYII